MKNFIFSIATFFGVIISYAQDYASVAAYQMREQWSAEKKKAFNANPNTQNYDIRYHRMDWTVDPNVYYISGSVTSQFIPSEDLNTIVFDLSDDLTVTEVKQGTNVLNFTHTNNEITIQLAQTVMASTLGEVQITYSGVPSSDNEAFTKSYHNGTPIIWTLSEPFGAKDWWPCKDDLNDKIENIDIFITTPSQYVSAANGLELSQTVHDNGTKTTHFQHNYPIPAYLVAFAVTNYQVFTQIGGTSPQTFPIVNYLYPESYDAVLPQLQQTLLVMDLFEDLFGTYPFYEEKYGHAQFGWNGGMEHTTVSFMGGFSRNLIAHELGHHWFGNKVTCATWQDIWINEGFAEYMAGLVVQHFDGDAAFVSWKQQKNQSITSLPHGNVYLTIAEAENMSRIFDGRLTYNKGSMVVHMLRDLVGDEHFFEAAQNILTDPELAFQSATTEQIKEHFETVSNLDLTEFFNDWIYNQGYPTFSLIYHPVVDHQLEVILSQTTSHTSVDFFEVPLKILLRSADNQEEMHILNHTQNFQTFILETSLPDVAQIVLNPYQDIICKVTTSQLSNDTIRNQREITVYPNPTTQGVYVEIPTSSYFSVWNLYDETGKRLLYGNQLWIDLETMASGKYLLEMKIDDAFYHKKIVKQ